MPLDQFAAYIFAGFFGWFSIQDFLCIERIKVVRLFVLGSVLYFFSVSLIMRSGCRFQMRTWGLILKEGRWFTP